MFKNKIKISFGSPKVDVATLQRELDPADRERKVRDRSSRLAPIALSLLQPHDFVCRIMSMESMQSSPNTGIHAREFF